MSTAYGDINPPASDPNGITHKTLECPHALVGYLIGKKGATIKNIKVSQPQPLASAIYLTCRTWFLSCVVVVVVIVVVISRYFTVKIFAKKSDGCMELILSLLF